MGDQSTEMKNLENLTKAEENEIVIELGADRVLHFLGVYIMLGLAAAAKLSEITANNLSCHPKNNKTGFDASFISFANTYCWVSPVANHPLSTGKVDSVCKIKPGETEKLMSDPDVIKIIIQWLPYRLLVQGIIFALPSAWWHFRVGARLIGHLKFMKLFMGELYDRLKEVPVGFYVGEPYDEKSAFLDGWCTRKKENSKDSQKRTKNQAEDVCEENSKPKTLEEVEKDEAEREHVLYGDVRGKNLTFIPEGNKKSENASPKKQSTEESSKPGDLASHDERSTSSVLLHDETAPSPSTISKVKDDPLEGTSKSTDPTRNTKTLVKRKREKTGRSLASTSEFKDDSMEVAEKSTLAEHGESSSTGDQSKASSSPASTKCALKNKCKEFWTVFCLGDMRDRQLFSMLCYENFSSLEYHPYLLSLFRLTRNIEYEPPEFRIMPLNEGILHQWCHEKNFYGHFLMRAYFAKYVLGILISVGFLISGSYAMNSFATGTDTGNFRCDVIFHEHICMICTMHRKTVSLALLIVNLVVNSLYLLLTISQWIFILRSPVRTTAHFFEDLRYTNSVAMWAELRNQQEKSKKYKEEREKKKEN